MPFSAVFRLERAFVSVFLSLASAYDIAPDISQDSDDDAILQAYRRVPEKVHLDNGRAKRKFKALGCGGDGGSGRLGEPRPFENSPGTPGSKLTAP